MGQKKTRRAFDREFKDGAVRMVTEQGRPASEVARDLGVRADLLYKWISAAKEHGLADAFPGSGKPHAEDDEVRRLREENRLLKMERDILKKNYRVLCGAPQMKFEAIEAQRGEFPVEVLCRILHVSKSGFYEWRGKAAKRDEREVEDQKLVRTIEAIHLGSKKKYGSPNVADRLKGLSFDVSESTVARRMKKHGIRSKLKRKFKATTDSDHKLPVAPNLLMQDFTAYRPDQIWMSDLTYVHTREGWLYVCAIIDLFSRKIVAWTASSRMTQDLVILAYLKARRARSPEKHLIFHSDRGSQYASRAFRELLHRDGVLQSMSRRACCWDSAPIESFWGRMKTECVFWENFATRQEALRVLHDWIERDYNAVRPHSSLGRMAPNEFEEHFALASRTANE